MIGIRDVVAPAGALVILVGLSLAPSPALADDDWEGWEDYKSEEYGFEMKVPAGARFAERELEGGWGVLHAKHEDVELFAVGKLGTQATPEEIERVGVKLSEIPADKWKKIDEGKARHGWTWWRTYEASDGRTLVFAGLGTGSKGSYLCFLKTTEADYAENKADYHKWYRSVKLR